MVRCSICHPDPCRGHSEQELVEAGAVTVDEFFYALVSEAIEAGGITTCQACGKTVSCETTTEVEGGGSVCNNCHIG